MNRKEALNAGAIRYNTGKPCKNGHNADRYAKSGACVNCIQELVKRSNGIQVTAGDMLKARSKLIYLYAQEKNLPIIKMSLDAFSIAAFPNINPEHVNEYPFKSVRVESQYTLRIRVRVPLEYVDEMFAIAKSIYENDPLLRVPMPSGS